MKAEGYDSDTIVRSIAYMKTHEDKIRNALNNFKTYHVHGNYQNAAVRSFIEQRVNANDFNLEEFYSGFGL